MADPLNGTHAVVVLPTDQVAPEVLAGARSLMDLAWPDPDDRFTDDDWDHALGGLHAYIRDAAGVVIAHASVVPRRLWIGEHPVTAGYVEAVAVQPDLQGQGLGSAVMEAIDALIRLRYELGVLGTGEDRFYARLGWERWGGTLWVRRTAGSERSPEEDGYVWVLRTPGSPPFSGDEPLSCEERPGDDW